MTEEQRYAKVPEGMAIKKPEQSNEGKPNPIKVKEFDIDPGLPIIQYPHYTDNSKTQLACILLRPDGMATIEKDIPNDKKHPLYRDILKQFTEEELLTNTAREIQIQTSRNKAIDDAKKQEERNQTRAKLWDIKSSFMDMDVVKNSDEKSLKRNLRKSTSYYEALGYGVAILIKENDKSE